jgi:hypothetical protein
VRTVLFIPLRVTQEMLADKTNTVLEAAQFMVMVSLLIKKGAKEKPEV